MMTKEEEFKGCSAQSHVAKRVWKLEKYYFINKSFHEELGFLCKTMSEKTKYKWETLIAHIVP
eukprot:9456656-Ditylum_brightwellii.AAC.1